MRHKSLVHHLIIGVWLTCAITLVHAGAPLWTFTPLTDTTITVAANNTATVLYKITNQSKKTHALQMKALSGVTQISTPSHCPNPFVLGYQESCLLYLSINGSALSQDILGGPIVCEQNNANQCYQPTNANSLHIIKGASADYTLGGVVFGLTGTLSLENNGNDVLTLNADGSFSFANSLSMGNAYLVTVRNQPVGQICTVTNGSGIVTHSNITNITVNCSANARTVGGSVSGLGGSQSLVLQNNGADTTNINSNGAFTFSRPIAQGASYNITILTQPSTQTCTLSNSSGTAGASNITNIQVTCSTNANTVGGIVSGLSGSVVLQNNGADNLTINSNGAFTFNNPVAQSAPYDVTVLTQPSGQTCTVSNGSGTMALANITNVAISCVSNTALLSTSVSQLALSITGLTEYGLTPSSSGRARMITITNTGSNPAINLSISLPAWPIGTSSTTTCGSTLAAGSNCTIRVTPGLTPTSDGTNPCSSGTAPVPGVVQINADNALGVSTQVVVLSYACVYQGGYVYAFDDTTSDQGSVGGKVVTTMDQAAASPNGIIWSSTNTGSYDNGVAIYGISEISTTSTPHPNTGQIPGQIACDAAIDGPCNTNNVYVYYQNNSIPLSFYSVGLCKQTISGYSDWYLPAICEMGYTTNPLGSLVCGLSSAPTLQNMQASLIDISHLSFTTGYYWSSTELSGGPKSFAWDQKFDPITTNSLQGSYSKTVRVGTRCSRALII